MRTSNEEWKMQNPDGSQTCSFNKSIRSTFKYTAGQGNVHANKKKFPNALLYAVRNAVTRVPPEQKHAYISGKTANATAGQQQAKTQGNVALEKQLLDQPYRLAQRHKTRWIFEMLEDLWTEQGTCRGIDIQRSNPYSVRSSWRSLEKTPAAPARYLEINGWGFKVLTAMQRLFETGHKIAQSS